MTDSPFEIGSIYHRRRDIHRPFKGQQQGGISTPRSVPYIFLFTGEEGEQYGYSDGWNKDGVFLYTGEGQIGDMQFIRGNQAVRDHITEGKELLLFETLGKGNCRFLGNFTSASWEPRTGPDKEKNQRQLIVFHLLLQEDFTEVSSSAPAKHKISLKELRRKAYEASSIPKEKDTKHTKRRYYERSEMVRAYVLARAGGECEACRKNAPFLRVNGSFYLEPHHTRRVSDGGPDDPKFVGGICPNCHREIHFGAKGADLNRRLQEYILRVEGFERKPRGRIKKQSVTDRLSAN